MILVRVSKYFEKALKLLTGMEDSKKDIIKLKFAICLTKLISRNKGLSGNENSFSVVTSLRQLEASSGVSFPIIQLTSIADRDIQLTTAIKLIESLNIKPSEFFKMYDELTEDDLKNGRNEIESRKKIDHKKDQSN